MAVMYVALSKYIKQNIKKTAEIYFKLMNTTNECTAMNGTNIQLIHTQSFQTLVQLLNIYLCV